MIQLFVRNALRYGFKRFIYPNMTMGNFNFVWTLLINNLKALPLRNIFNIAMSLSSSQKVVRAITIERLIEPIIKNHGILKPEVKAGNSELLVKTLFSLITFSRGAKFILKIVLWLPKLVLTLFVLSLTNIDVSFFQGIISWVTFGLSNSLTLFLSTMWTLLVYLFNTGEMLNLNFLKNISEPVSLDELLNDDNENENSSILTENGDSNSSKKTISKWSNSSKNLIKIVSLFILNITIKHLLDTEIVSDYLKQHSWLEKGSNFFQWTYKFGKDINNVLIDNVPLYGRVEHGITAVVGGTLTYSYYFLDKIIITPTKWSTSTIYNYGIKTPYKYTKSFLGSSLEIGIKKPFRYITSYFSISEDALAEINKLKEENELLKSKTLKRQSSRTSAGSWIQRWTIGTSGANPVGNPRTAPATPIGSSFGHRPWDTPTAPPSPSDIKNNDPALSTVEEEGESDLTPKSTKPVLEEEVEVPFTVPDF